MEDEPQQIKKSISFTTPLLIGLVVIAAFFVGTLYTKVQLLEKNSKLDTANNNQAQDTKPVVAGANDSAGSEEIGEVTPVSSEDHMNGSKDAQLMLIEYSDFECPFSKRFNDTMLQVMKEYGGKVAWVYRNYPLPFHANAQKEAEASECVAELGGNEAFWKFAEAIYNRTTGNGTGFALTDLKPLAVEMGVNGSAFQQCLDSGKYTQKVKNDITTGQKAGINGTPGTIILTKDGKKELIPGALPFEDVKKMLDKYLQ